ncbi:MAG: hypothetical protein H3C34_26055, partial [Caldilineaceae bacterium]|nr:hypothetical protein [Caldilineaceae bacterium]
MANRLPDDLIAQLATLETPDALEELRARGLLISPAAAELATFALTQAHDDPQLALQWLTLARGVQTASGNAPEVEASILYAEARLQVLNGELAVAERTLERASSYWQSTGDTMSLARSGLGLTQILAMQGRLDEAEATILKTIADLESLALPDATLLLLDARQNHATLLSYQERYQEALAIDAAIGSQLAELLAAEDEAQARAELQQRLGLILLDSAVALTYLDRPADAEAALREAISLLSQANAPVDRGRAQTNL